MASLLGLEALGAKMSVGAAILWLAIVVLLAIPSVIAFGFLSGLVGYEPRDMIRMFELGWAPAMRLTRRKGTRYDVGTTNQAMKVMVDGGRRAVRAYAAKQALIESLKSPEGQETLRMNQKLAESADPVARELGELMLRQLDELGVLGEAAVTESSADKQSTSPRPYKFGQPSK